MYRQKKPKPSSINGTEKFEGETIEQKVRRIMETGEPIKDGAPIIYTEKSKGVDPAHNIRTDRWEIAAAAMDVVHRSKTASRDNNPDKGEAAEGAADKEVGGDA